MRVTIVTLALLLATAGAPGALGTDGGEDLREENRAVLLEGLDREVPDNVTATVYTNGHDRTMPAPEALSLLLDRLDAAGIDLAALEEDPGASQRTAAGQGTFPLVGTDGFVVEGGLGGGLLPTTCEEAIKHHQVSNGTLRQAPAGFNSSHDGFMTSTLSNYTASKAVMGGPTGVTNDTVRDYQDTIIAGPNHDTACVQFDSCFFGFCFWFLKQVTTLSAGIVDNGTVAEQVHQREPVNQIPSPPEDPTAGTGAMDARSASSVLAELYPWLASAPEPAPSGSLAR